jgi:hypothetical protein
MFKSTLMIATAAAIALSSFDARPAQAAPQGGPAIAKQHSGIDEVSAARKRRRGYGGGAFPLAAFGMIAGTIATIAATESRRGAYPAYYDDDAAYAGVPVYAEPEPVYGYGYGNEYGYGNDYGYGYAPGRVYAPHGYAPRGHYAPRVNVGPRAFQGRVGGGGAPRQFVQRNVQRPAGPAMQGGRGVRGGQRH